MFIFEICPFALLTNDLLSNLKFWQGSQWKITHWKPTYGIMMTIKYDNKAKDQ